MEGKISDSEKSDIQAKLDALKEALKGSDIDTIKAKQEEAAKSLLRSERENVSAGGTGTAGTGCG